MAQSTQLRPISYKEFRSDVHLSSVDRGKATDSVSWCVDSDIPMALNSEASPSKRPKLELSDSDNCGVCFSEEGRAARGYIDSCDHYFCFVCILEWSKVESRCPLCKRRFTSIRRPPKDGVFPSERLVNIPQRDQAYHPLGNITITQADPYAEIKCYVCKGSEDEYHLLLCDLCDSGAHSYCVGLGTTIPEGDWFCHDCKLSRADHEKSDEEKGENKEDLSAKLKSVPKKEVKVEVIDDVRECSESNVGEETNELGASDVGNVSIVDIVGGYDVSRVRRSLAADGSHSKGRSGVREWGGGHQRRLKAVVDKRTESSARTLRRCRNVQRQVRMLRENWNALRRGSLSFPSGTVVSSVSGKQKDNGTPAKRLVQLESPSPATTQGVMVCSGSSSGTSHSRWPYDTDKAWKMMEEAKSLQQIRGGKSFNRQVLEHFPLIRKAPKESSDVNSISLKLKSKVIEASSSGRTIESDKDFKRVTIGDDRGKHKFSNLPKEYRDDIVKNRSLIFSGSVPITQSAGSVGRRALCHSNNLRLCPNNDVLNANVLNLRYGSAHLASPIESDAGAADLSDVKQVPHLSSSCKGDPAVRNGGTESGHSKGKMRTDVGPKSEIQALVKLNLKLLSKKNHLEVSVFKDVARLATHTILAACGLEHQKPGIHPLPSSICCHSEEVRRARNSILMPSSCRECFYIFIKDVVNSILLEKTKPM